MIRLVSLALIALFAITPTDLRTQFAIAAATFVVALLTTRRRTERARLVLIGISIAATARYLFWRFTSTLDDRLTLEAVLAAALLLAELYSCAMMLLSYVQSAAPLARKPLPLPGDPRHWPTVDVFIPTYNEPLEVVRTTVLAARAIDWPPGKLRIHLLDDGRRPAFEKFAAEAGVGYLTRPDNKHAKAGNLNHALSVTEGEFVAIFDCDHVPARSFLQVTLGWLVHDARIALVQTPHHFYSPDPYSRNLATAPRVPPESELFYGVIQPGLDTWNAAFFCGSCAVLRRSALLEVGGIATDTVTEDAHTALRLHRRGWKSAYLAVPQAAGLETETFSAHVGQRIRWARGMAQIFRLDNPLLGRGLQLGQRLSYLAAMLHFFGGIPRLLFLVAPVGYLVFGLHIYNAVPLAAVAYGLPHLVHSTAATARLNGRHRHSFWSEVYETCLAWYVAIPTTLALFAPRKGRFNVTAKGGRIEAARFDARIAAPLLGLAAVNLLALAAGLARLPHGALPHDRDSLAINLVWVVHNLVILGACIAVACERRQVRAAPRVAVRAKAMVRLGDGSTVRARSVTLSRDGGSFQLAASIRLLKRERVALSLFGFGEERALPAEVVRANGRTLSVRFAGLDLDEEEHLTRVIFSRADAWVGWDEGHARDRPVRNLGAIAAVALGGVVRTLGTSLRPRRAPRLVRSQA